MSIDVIVEDVRSGQLGIPAGILFGIPDIR